MEDQQNNNQVEYITLAEALDLTGLAEKTLREKLRGKVPMIGRSAWFREEFFQFWKDEHEQKHQDKTSKKKEVESIVQNLLAKGA